jgi:hypothetical protein
MECQQRVKSVGMGKFTHEEVTAYKLGGNEVRSLKKDHGFGA